MPEGITHGFRHETTHGRRVLFRECAGREHGDRGHRSRPQAKAPPAGVGGLVGPHLQVFFAEHLLAHKRATPQTIACYRDTFRLLLRFMRQRTGAEPSTLPLAAVDADAVLAFLDHVEHVCDP